MKLIITQNIDGYDIVTNISTADTLIDQEATKPFIEKKIKETEIFKEISKIKNQMNLYASQVFQAKKNFKNAKTQNEKRKFSDEFAGRLQQMKELEEQLKPLAPQLKKIYTELMFSEAIYFTPKQGEFIVDDLTAQQYEKKMVEATQKNCVVDKDFNLIVDNRGAVYWKKIENTWIKDECLKLGDVIPEIAVIENDLNEQQKQEISEQIEKQRISKLTKTQKESEKNGLIDSLINQAAIIKSRLEIEGNNEALNIAQEWLNTEKSKVALKYG